MPDDLWYHERPGGGDGVVLRDCLLLESDTGALTDELLLEDGSGCLLLESDGAPPVTDSFLLVQSSAGTPEFIVLLQSGGGDGVKLQNST